MAERFDVLESRLRALAAETEFPPTPDVAAAVRTRIAVAPVPPKRFRFARRPSRRALAVAIACVVALPAAAIAAVPGARHAVLDWLGLRSVRVRTVPALPGVWKYDRDRLRTGRAESADFTRGRSN